MTEQISDNDSWDIDRSKSPEKIIDLGGMALKLTYANTSVYRFSKGYAMLDHAYRVADGGSSGIFIFDSNELLNDLTDLWFPTHLMPYPDDNDISAYRDYQKQQLEEDIRGLGEQHE